MSLNCTFAAGTPAAVGYVVPPPATAEMTPLVRLTTRIRSDSAT
jgi:hypothetical protein